MESFYFRLRHPFSEMAVTVNLPPEILSAILKVSVAEDDALMHVRLRRVCQLFALEVPARRTSLPTWLIAHPYKWVDTAYMDGTFSTILDKMTMCAKAPSYPYGPRGYPLRAPNNVRFSRRRCVVWMMWRVTIAWDTPARYNMNPDEHEERRLEHAARAFVVIFTTKSQLEEPTSHYCRQWHPKRGCPHQARHKLNEEGTGWLTWDERRLFEDDLFGPYIR
jgi:hypothetical protein